VEWVVASVAVLLPAALVLPRCWEGRDDFGVALLLVFALSCAVPAWSLVVLALFVARRLRRNARPVALSGAIVLSWAALVPLGDLVEGMSVAESKRRLEAIGAAAERYREQEGAYPADLDDLRRKTGLALPGPTWGTGFSMLMEEGRLVLRIWAPVLIDDRGWLFDTATRSWRAWST
jgi:hypothetical protein